MYLRKPLHVTMENQIRLKEYFGLMYLLRALCAFAVQ
jgi:hypothetical protein